ncbi:HAAS signaling domain-containing protein [Bacillus mycoides]|uniref:HAAS signaling domain-containing protein n=1 Tax=Bacillus mycoides TaxID=1405 RepID=UPI003D0691B2
MISKENFFSNSLIKSFIDDLTKSLSRLPSDLKEQHILEIKSDLHSNALEKEKNGISEEKLPQEVLKEFISPKQLANEILLEYTDNDLLEKEKISKGFSYAITISISSFVALSIPIALKFINISSNLPFIFAFLVANIWILFNKKQWNNKQSNHLKKLTKFRNPIIGIAFAMFAISIITDKQINMFSLYYLFMYVIICLIYFKFLKYIYKQKA